MKERERGNACLYEKRSRELSSGKWNKRSTSHHISPQPLDKTCQIGTATSQVNPRYGRTCKNAIMSLFKRVGLQCL